MARRELEVKADWHVQVGPGRGRGSGGGLPQPHRSWEALIQMRCPMQVHRSKVTALSFSAGGSALWSGGDAAVPKPTAAEGDEPLVAAVDPSVSGAGGSWAWLVYRMSVPVVSFPSAHFS